MARSGLLRLALAAAAALGVMSTDARPAHASQGETYGTLGGGYSLRTTDDGLLHGPGLMGGIGWFPSDFTVGEVTANYTLGIQDDIRQMLGVQAHFRLLIDAFEWVPSVGPLLGLTGVYVPGEGLDAFMDLGVEGCVAWRGSRESAWRACGQISIVPTHVYYQSLFSLSFSYDWFLGL